MGMNKFTLEHIEENYSHTRKVKKMLLKKTSNSKSYGTIKAELEKRDLL